MVKARLRVLSSLSLLLVLVLSLPGLSARDPRGLPTTLSSSVDSANNQEIQNRLESKRRNFEIANKLLRR